jgi:uncharacterized phage-associated protein
MPPKIEFRFDARRAAAAAAYLLKLHGGELNHMKLIKLLYVADRTSLDRFGRPIVGDRYVSMKHGPVLSRVYNFIKEEDGTPSVWSVLIERGPDKMTVRLLDNDPSFDALSAADLEILEEIAALYKEWNQYKLRDMTHQEFEEWQNPGTSSRELPVERVLEVGLKKSPEEIARVRQSAAEKKHFENIFGAA